MRILHVDTGRELRGGQRQVLLLLEQLAARGMEQTLLARREGPLYAAARQAGWRVRPASLFALANHARTADVVHAHDATAHTLALASRKALVVSRRVSFPVRRGWLSAWKYRRANCFLAVSHFVAGELTAAGVPALRIRYVPDGVRCSTFQWQWSAGAPVVALDSGDARKGTALVRDAASKISIPIVFSTDLSHDLQRASAFLYITHSEGLGSAALLAMSMGVPVIASRVGGLAEVFEDGISGVHVENDLQVIARAVERVSNDRELAVRLGAAGRLRACQFFSAELLVERTLAAYRSVL